MRSGGPLIADARAAYDARAWSRAYDLFAHAGDLDVADLDRYAVSAHLSGRVDEYFAIRERAYDQRLASGDALGAAEEALWIGCQRMAEGQVGPGSGWLARAARIVLQDGTDSAAAAYLTVAEAFGAASGGDLDRAVELTRSGAEACRRHDRMDLVALALHQEGLFLLAAGRHEEGIARLDEAMVTIGSAELSAMVTGIVYCGTISGCWTVHDVGRAQEWTAAMSQWCDSQPELATFTAECKVRRAELKELRGDWAAALDELAGVSTADVDVWAAGAAACLRGNLHRLQGRFDDADVAFSEAGKVGFDPQPGLALLRLAQGSVQAAAAMIRRSLAETTEDATRMALLAAAVEILVAVGDRPAAQSACTELGLLAAHRQIPVVVALNGQAQAMLHLAEGSPEQALPPARSALQRWVELRAPYPEARARLLLASACRALGDTESGKRELDLAVATFEALGAAPDLARLRGVDGVLTARELEVLRLVATGATNRAIAEQLVLSERTVDRHVSNLFTKLGVSSRAGATAYAFEKGLA